jgi:hypothetical protein
MKNKVIYMIPITKEPVPSRADTRAWKHDPDCVPAHTTQILFN